MTKISDKQLKKLAPKAAVKAAAAKVARAAPKTAAAAKKFGADEMSFGIGKALRLKTLKKDPGGGLLGKLKPKPFDLGEIMEHIHDAGVARKLKGAITLLTTANFPGKNQPLPPGQGPQLGKDGRYHAPNGDPLVPVKLSEKNFGTAETSSSRVAYVNPKTNEYYVVDMHGSIGPAKKKAYGPFDLPRSLHFQDQEFTPAELNRLQELANQPQPFVPGFPGWPHHPPQSPPLFPQGPQQPLPFPMQPGHPGIGIPGLPISPAERKAIEKLLGRGTFDAPAPKPGDVLSETPYKHEHPFSYTIIRLKDDPDRVIIKRVLTGGFVPAKPGDGSYSAPIAL